QLKSLKVLPEYLLSCNKTSPDVDSCIRDSFNHLRHYLAKGIPELNMKPIEPLNIEHMTMENGQGSVRVRALFSNMTVLGAGNFSTVSVKSDLGRLRIDLGLRIPRITATGRYEVTDDITAVVQLHGRSEERDGEKFMNTEKLGVDFHLGGEAMNHFLNENANEIIDEMKPAASMAIARHFRGFLNQAFLQIPLRLWLLD
ncbi:hypothetical protein B566_EDAN017378, partial [Ephemera danica]